MRRIDSRHSTPLFHATIILTNVKLDFIFPDSRTNSSYVAAPPPIPSPKTRTTFAVPLAEAPLPPVEASSGETKAGPEVGAQGRKEVEVISGITRRTVAS